MFGGHSDIIKFKMSSSFRRGLLFPFFLCVNLLHSRSNLLKEYSTEFSLSLDNNKINICTYLYYKHWHLAIPERMLVAQ